MYNFKVIHSLSLLLCFSLLLTGFGSVNVSAATNLVEPDLTLWSNTSNGTDNSETGVMYVNAAGSPGKIIYVLVTQSYGTVNDIQYFYSYCFDETTLNAGDSYTFSMHIPSFDEIRAKTTYQYTNDTFVSKLGGGFSICFGLLQSDGTMTLPIEFISITKDNYANLQGTDFVSSFVCPDYSGANPCIVIVGSNPYSGNSLFLDGSMTLISADEEEEEGFLSKLFAWFKEQFDSIGDSFSNLGNKLSTGFTNLGDRIKTFFSDLGDSISSGLAAVKEGIQDKLDQVKTTLVELGENLIQGIQNLFIPDEEYILEWKDNLDKLLQEHLGMIYTSANLVTDLVQKIFDIVFNAPESYGLTVPEVSFEILNGTQINLIPETEISFDFLENKTFKFIYGLYTVGLYIAFGVLEVKYGIRVYKKVMSN